MTSIIQLDEVARNMIEGDTRRIVIVGAGGWIGRTLLAGLHQILGASGMGQRVVCFGSATRTIDFGLERTIAQRPLADLANLPPEPTMLFHLAFLTKDKVAGMDAVAYAAQNRAISATVLGALDEIGVDRAFIASSGAAAFADDPDAAPDLALYGALKREDELAFARWGEGAEGRRVMVMRIFSLIGPFINKHDTYAMASFILDALDGRPISVKAPMQVMRSYVAVSELLSLALAYLLRDDAGSLEMLDSGGAPMELAEAAQLVAECLGGQVNRAPVLQERANIYVSNPARYDALLEEYAVKNVGLRQAVMDTAAYLAVMRSG